MKIYFWSARRVCLISAVGANPQRSTKIGVRILLKHRPIDKISKNWKVLFLIFKLVKNHHFLPIKYRFSQNRLTVSLWKCENQVRDRKLGLERCLVVQFFDFHFWPSIHVRVPSHRIFFSLALISNLFRKIPAYLARLTRQDASNEK